ncbi:MAG: hypothetical protein KC502_17435, partial [Myxococcales bacterium]|nr:hypothetical protein [Myxococcales bacterium]
MHHPRLFPQRLSRLALAAAATCFLSCGLIACGSDADNPSGSTAVDVAGGDSVTAADGEGSDGSTPDTNATDAANADILANDTKTTQTDASDAAVAADKDGGSIADVTSADVATSDAGGDDVGSPDAGEADATTPKPKSCKGTLQCGFYLQMGDAKACAADPGCQMVGTKCVGFATKITCAKAPNQQGCTMALGCAWTDCQVTNGGVEVCDGVDNDCDGVTDNADTPKGGICNDGDLCNGDEPCTAGKCEAAVTALTCPTKLCHSASCDKTKGCVQTPNTNACDDGNACTTEDACNAGLCKGGKNKDCDDKNVCTKDSCSAGKCVHTKINSCVGPTDYQAMSLVGTKASYVGPATLSFSLTVKNEGKAYYGVSSGLLKWELWYSADDKLGTGDTKAMSAKTWSGKNLGIGNGFKNLQGTVGGGFVVTTRASIPKTAKFVCAKLVSASDTNATNNVACAALPTVLWPEYQVKSLKLSVTDI